ncbi:MAG: hypothetical protein C0462_02855 [Alcanivorax sp.]|nr:hypothetical protein [Alcanivorax sp.]
MVTTVTHRPGQPLAWLLLALPALMLLNGCSSRPADDAATIDPAPAPAQTAPATQVTYRGVLPCPDCEGLNVELMLDYRENIYRATETRLTANGEADTPQRSVGQWRRVTGNEADPAATIYQLDFDRPATTRNFLRLDAQRIKLLDEFKREFWSPFNLLLEAD